MGLPVYFYYSRTPGSSAISSTMQIVPHVFTSAFNSIAFLSFDSFSLFLSFFWFFLFLSLRLMSVHQCWDLAGKNVSLLSIHCDAGWHNVRRLMTSVCLKFVFSWASAWWCYWRHAVIWCRSIFWTISPTQTITQCCAWSHSNIGTLQWHFSPSSDPGDSETQSNTDVSELPGEEGLPPRARYRLYSYAGSTLRLAVGACPSRLYHSLWPDICSCITISSTKGGVLIRHRGMMRVTLAMKTRVLATMSVGHVPITGGTTSLPPPPKCK